MAVDGRRGEDVGVGITESQHPAGRRVQLGIFEYVVIFERAVTQVRGVVGLPHDLLHHGEALSKSFTITKGSCITLPPPETVFSSASISSSLSSRISTLALTLRSVVLLMISLHPCQRRSSV